MRRTITEILAAKRRENAEAGVFCVEHYKPEPCPVCRIEVAADDRRAQLKDERR